MQRSGQIIINRAFPGSTVLYFFLSNDLESYKKEAYIHPNDFIRELKQSQRN